ncbi:type II toxin-antitoxin system PemI/MazE family antitoxin [Lacticaseibacillus pantheris]|jgi:hypothetical protein|uniref:type II toxin-antitoxin system PemI/MazE family antitoxin n=1 Tax=Lacticaseibacillus pantheris TaxID=171523 RepID=UPI002657C446|nr:AbrB/MazE/SpoVT family DNA-binding domain-containing protein [Lacticaseibacillus pantheris]WKF85855.1 AbrB/MazE/SpoVT family DNA-binding domain-containing protein [Lacticaseibacillus pantheris]
MQVRARKVGHSIALTVPRELDVKNGQEFEVHRENNGAIVYSPKHRNPFEGGWFNKDLRQTDILDNREVLDSEWD